MMLCTNCNFYEQDSCKTALVFRSSITKATNL